LVLMGAASLTSPKLKFFGLGMLKEHEYPQPSLTKYLLEEIRADGVLKRPIAVDENTNVILDGHARLTCLSLLVCKIIPAYLFDYRMPEIIVRTYRRGERISKDYVIKAGLTGKKMPPKSSKHLVRLKSGRLVHISSLGKEVNIPLEDLKSTSYQHIGWMISEI